MNWKDFDNDVRISKIGKAVFLILIIVAGIALFRNTISVVALIMLLGAFLIAYGKELIMPYLSNELRLLWEIGDLGIAFVKMFIVLLKTKGSLTNRDLDILESYFTKEYNKEIGAEVRIFVQKNFYLRYNIISISRNISQVIRGKEKIQLIHQLFRFCEYTGGVTSAQKKIISRIAKEIRLNVIHFQNIENKFTRKRKAKTEQKKQSSGQNSKQKYQYRRKQSTTYSSLSYAYRELGVVSTISNQDLRKVYRDLAKKYHPDKWQKKGTLERQKAKEKFQKINNAYSVIKKSRNMK